jgi:hypothetical protein
MRSLSRASLHAPLVVLLWCGLQGSALAQQAAAFDPHDFSGFWNRGGYQERREGIQIVGGCRDCGDNGIGTNVPPFTPEGQKRYEANKPAYGRPAGSPPVAGEPEGRRRAVASAVSNDPSMLCEPLGVTRMLMDTYFSPLEFIFTKDRLIEHAEWTDQWREIWMDGRKLPDDPDLQRWYGYSIGRWDGNTLVVDSFGYDDRTWLDYYGYPHSDQMRLEERYRRIAPDRIEFELTVTDPEIYTKPWVSDKKVLRKMPPERTTLNGWYGMLEDKCVPTEEADFNKKVRDPAAGIAK